MNSFSSWLAKGEALAKQVADQAASVAEKAKSEEWVAKLSHTVSDVRIFLSNAPEPSFVGCSDSQSGVQECV